MENPLVTVFIPVYNSEVYIKESLDSILNQTYTNIEILIVDDGSTDKSIDIIKSFNDSRIRIISNKENRGIPFSRNVGLTNSNGKYMAIMDADDIAVLNRIEIQVDFMEKNQDIDAIGTYYEMFGGRLKRTFETKYTSSEEVKAKLLFSSPIGNPTSFVRLEKIKEYNLSYNLNYFVAQDYDFWVQLSKVGKLEILPKVLLKYRTGHLNITQNTKGNKAIQRKKIIDSIHSDIINYYNFKLSEKELESYNEFFNDNPQSRLSNDTQGSIPSIVEKLLLENQKSENFVESILVNIIEDSVVFSLSKHDLSVISKLNLYKKVCKVLKVKPKSSHINYLFIKHLYKKVFA
ncbi:glycosyltransferase [Bacillus sp. JJ1521]|uniref:glycosyltransferase family 2 protein n=1 Tax=Bacillus sp. JJ1521 TaxID=3122957 RepID=UPI002FFE41C4